MLSRTNQQVVIGIVAAVWLVLALLSGQALSPTPLKLYSIAGTVVALAFVSYDRLFWRWKLVRKLTGVPLLAGTWRGTLISSYEPTPGRPLPPIPVAVLITQTASSVTVTLFSGESSSVSTQTHLRKLEDGRWSLDWIYENTPRPAVRDRSDRHVGAAELYVSGQGGSSLEGAYFTDRLTRGELQLDEWSSQQHGDAASALQSAEFRVPRPFA